MLKVILEFISDLEKATGIQKTILDIAAMWEEHPPAGILKPLEEYINTVSKFRSLIPRVSIAKLSSIGRL